MFEKRATRALSERITVLRHRGCATGGASLRSVSKLRRWNWSGGSADYKFGIDSIFFPVRISRTGKFVESIGGHAAEQIAMDVYRRERGIAVFGETGLVKTGDRNILRHAAARLQQCLDDPDCGQIIDGHYGGRPRTEARDGEAGFESSVEP